MPSTRRSFLQRLAAGAAFAAGGTPALQRDPLASEQPLLHRDSKWDMSWVEKLTGKHRVVFDVPEINEGAGVLRAWMWMQQYAEVYGTTDQDLSVVVVVRHVAIPFAMNDQFWSRHELGKQNKLKDLATKKWTARNPVLSAANPKEVVGPVFSGAGLDGLMGRGVIVLACNVAFDRIVALETEANKGISQDDARKRALEALVPGVTLMPSGVFAVSRAQEAGCHYVLGS